MHVLITGGTGFVGTRTRDLLLKEGHKVTIITRQKHQSANHANLNYIQHDPLSGPFPREAFHNSLGTVDAVINLMGENIGKGRWTESMKEKIRKSRIEGTSNLVAGIDKHLDSLSVLVSASAIGYYPANLDREITEDELAGNGFLPQVCADWEKAASTCQKAQRIVYPRIGVVLGNGGGALEKLIPIFKLGAGGPIGSGKAMMSWIHVEDLARLLVWLLTSTVSGPINAVAGNDSNYNFGRALAKALHRPYLFPVPPFMLKLVFGDMSSLMLDSQKVVAKKLAKTPFQFQFPKIEQALENIANSTH